MTLLCVDSFAQDTESENARTALKAGSSKELAAMLDNVVDGDNFGEKICQEKCGTCLEGLFRKQSRCGF